MESLIEEREEYMIPLAGSKQPIKRKAFFLNPTSSLIHDKPFIPQHYAISSNIQQDPKLDDQFRYWADPQKHWGKWVQKLQPKYKDLWKKVGIFDAINASTYQLSRDKSSLWGVARFWCEETNTFIFPWAEATVTLEDVMIIGGFSVFGEPVRVDGSLEGELGDIESQFKLELISLRREDGRFGQSTWIEHCSKKLRSDELEHVAFLLLWLWRFALPANNWKTSRDSRIQIACRLAKGVRVALAPAVLANIYRALRTMKDCLTNPNGPGDVNVRLGPPKREIWAPLNILQIWIWERFLNEKPKKAEYYDEPRAARWIDNRKMMGSSFVMLICKSPNNFQWQPYDGRSKHEELQSLVRCLRACELVGLDCIEQYNPHRVAMQFGFDQDIPKAIPRANSTWKLAWETYDKGKNVNFYASLGRSETAITQRYSTKKWKHVGKEEIVANNKRRFSPHLLHPHFKEEEIYHDNSSTIGEKHMKSNPSLNCTEEMNMASYAPREIEDEGNLKAAVNRTVMVEPEADCEMSELERSAAVRVKELVEAKCRLKEMKEQAAARVKEVSNELEVEKLKEEICIFEEIVMDLGYLAEMYSKSELVSSLG